MNARLIIITFVVLCFGTHVSPQNVGDMEIFAEWVQLEYDWPSEESRNASVADGTYIRENNVITGIKTYDNDVYVTVSRWLPGVPSTLNKVNQTQGHLLQPYPSWEMNAIDDCEAFQFTQSMEVNPTTGEMWVIDTGRRNIWLNESINNCPPKLIIIDLHTGKEIHRYTFPNTVVSWTENFINDIVIDPDRGFAYISDVGLGPEDHHGGIVFYDRDKDEARRLEHPSMHPEVNRPDGGYDITINGTPYPNSVASDGIALSDTKQSLFYCPLGGVHLYQVETHDVQACKQDVCQLTDSQVRDMGEKISESDGILWGRESLYFAALGLNAIYRWDHEADMIDQGVNNLIDVNMTRQVLVKLDDNELIWCDTFALDDFGWLWTTANKLPMFKSDELDYTGASGANFRIAKVFVDDLSYLSGIVSSATSFSMPFYTLLAALLSVVIITKCNID